MKKYDDLYNMLKDIQDFCIKNKVEVSCADTIGGGATIGYIVYSSHNPDIDGTWWAIELKDFVKSKNDPKLYNIMKYYSSAQGKEDVAKMLSSGSLL